MQIAILLGILLVAFFVNLPLGRLRARTKKFSWQWFAFVHASVPIIIVMRLASGLGYEVIPLELAAAIGGQLLGSSVWA